MSRWRHADREYGYLERPSHVISSVSLSVEAEEPATDSGRRLPFRFFPRPADCRPHPHQLTLQLSLIGPHGKAGASGQSHDPARTRLETGQNVLENLRAELQHTATPPSAWVNLDPLCEPEAPLSKIHNSGPVKVRPSQVRKSGRPVVQFYAGDAQDDRPEHSNVSFASDRLAVRGWPGASGTRCEVLSTASLSVPTRNRGRSAADRPALFSELTCNYPQQEGGPLFSRI